MENLKIVAVLDTNFYLLAPADADPRDTKVTGYTFNADAGTYRKVGVHQCLKFMGAYSKPFEGDPAPILAAFARAIAETEPVRD